MSIRTIQQLINGKYKDTHGDIVHVPIKSVYIDRDLSSNAADLLYECGLEGKALVVSDENTHIVLGAKIEEDLGASKNSVQLCFVGGLSLIFANGVKPDISNVEKIKDAAKSVDYIVAVGSGTINDLCKYASFLIGKPYAVFGTAPSMNGYGSANASITIAGHKKTLKAHLPQGIFLDLDVLVKAPLRLIKSGLGDSVCRSTAQADWLLSHLLLGTFYTDLPFELLNSKGIKRRHCEESNEVSMERQSSVHNAEEWIASKCSSQSAYRNDEPSQVTLEESLFANSAALVKGDIEIMYLLASTLVLSGFGMYLAGGSYPASQGEHMIAHTMEMLYGDILPYSYHGEQIGVTTLTMARLQEDLLCKEVLQAAHLHPGEGREREEFVAIVGNELASECFDAYKAKQFSQEKLNQRNKNILLSCSDIIERISSSMLPYETIYTTLKNAGCPLIPKDIGWDDGQYNHAVHFAKFTRDRFTFLDLGSRQ